MKDERPAIGQQRDGAHIRSSELEAVLLQLHITYDIGTERAGVMRERGAAEAWVKFFGNGRAAHLGAAFENQRFESGFGEIEGGDQTVVSATDDDHVARFGHTSMRLRLSKFRAPPDVPARP